MKYIRTKDEIFTQERYEIAKTFVGVLQDEQARIMPIEKTDFSIIKEAETIEELCDEFVLENIDDIKYAKRIFVYQDKIDKGIVALVKEKSINFYGAIWADKGLIYVAKMNDKGELELL